MIDLSWLSPWVPSWLWSWLPRFLLPLCQKMLDWLFPNRSRTTQANKSRAPRLIFIEQPGSSWDYLDDRGEGRLQIFLYVTNESNTDALIVSRVQVRLLRAGWKFLFLKGGWQDCTYVEVGDNRLTPMFVGIPLPARTTTVVRIIHHYKKSEPEPKRSIKCRLRITDQHGRLHYARLTVPSR
jgi:hypothetical protein